jgi:hypothetical protein
MTIPLEKLKARLLGNSKVKAEYDALAPEFEIAAELLRARLRAGLSQAELAARMGTSQSTAKRCRARRRCCAMPRQPAANSTCGCRRPDVVLARRSEALSCIIARGRATVDEDDCARARP